MIIVDYYRRFFEADEMRTNNYTKLIIQKLIFKFSK